jgi:hypothetical protein
MVHYRESWWGFFISWSSGLIAFPLKNTLQIGLTYLIGEILMQAPDVINGVFELVGSVMCWLNVYKIIKDKRIEGVYWSVSGFFSVWGLWNLYYYPTLGQWASFAGGIFLAAGNITWTLLAIRYSRLNRLILTEA